MKGLVEGSSEELVRGSARVLVEGSVIGWDGRI